MRKLRMSELGRLDPEAFKAAEKHPLVIALDNVRSTLNVGSVFRSADAFRVEQLILGGLSPEPSKEMRKTALGATEAVDWQKAPDLPAVLARFRDAGYLLWAIEQTNDAQKLGAWQADLNQKQLFVFGNEVSGVSEEVLALCHGAIEIPQFGTKHSLNISVSAGIVMWDFIRQLKA